MPLPLFNVTTGPQSESSPPATLVVACGRPLAKAGFRTLIESGPGLSVVGEAETGDAALALVEEHVPSVLVTDLMIPGLSPFSILQAIGDARLPTRVIGVSLYADPTYLAEAERAGIAGFVSLYTSREEFLALVRRVIGDGQGPGGQGVTPESLRNAGGGELRSALEGLSLRERQTFALAVEGFTSREVAERLYISPRTAEGHRAQMLRKLGLRSQADLVRFAALHGLLSGSGSGDRNT